MIFTRRYDNKFSECIEGRGSTTLHLRQRQLDLQTKACPMFFGMSLNTTINYEQDVEAIEKLLNVHRARKSPKLFYLLQGWLISAYYSYILQRSKSCGICQNKNTN